ncbi:MAG: DNA repair protein RecO [Bacteroidetes bacterium 4572_117]|nr:MAG: DNA repair protein RecO [Bacteroidetes bacterium 4572_117]
MRFSEKTRGIVLQQIKYSDGQVIVQMYTEQFGRQPFIFRKTKKKGGGLNIIHPLFLLEIDLSFKENRQIQRAIEISNTPYFVDIPFNVYKSSMAIFLAEVLSKVLIEEEGNKHLFEFLHNSILLLDEIEDGLANFHIVFLYQLSKYLGFYPEKNLSGNQKHFNIAEGRYSAWSENIEYLLNKQESRLFTMLAEIGFSEINELKLSRGQRQSLLIILLDYYRYHLPEMGKVKSLEILKQIFEG